MTIDEIKKFIADDSWTTEALKELEAEFEKIDEQANDDAKTRKTNRTP